MADHYLIIDNELVFANGIKSVVSRVRPNIVVDSAVSIRAAMAIFTFSVKAVFISPSVIDRDWPALVAMIENCPIVVLTESRRAYTPFVLFRDMNIIGTLERDANMQIAMAIIEQIVDTVSAYGALSRIDAERFTEGQMQILRLVAAGHADEEVASHTGRRITEVRAELRQIMRLAHVMYREELGRVTREVEGNERGER